MTYVLNRIEMTRPWLAQQKPGCQRSNNLLDSTGSQMTCLGTLLERGIPLGKDRLEGIGLLLLELLDGGPAVRDLRQAHLPIGAAWVAQYPGENFARKLQRVFGWVGAQPVQQLLS